MKAGARTDFRTVYPAFRFVGTNQGHLYIASSQHNEQASKGIAGRVIVTHSTAQRDLWK